MKLKGKRLAVVCAAITAPSIALGAEGAMVAPYAYRLGEIFGFPITNAMVTGWIISLLLILVVRLMVGRPKMIPTKGQAIIESVVQMVNDLIEPVVGKHMVRPSFPLLAGLFTFILIHNWSGLLPGVGTFGFIDDGHLTYWMRPANSDLNMTVGLALAHFVVWLYLIFKYAGPKAVVHEIFGNKANKKDVPAIVYYFLFIIFTFVGLIEIISILFRNVSLPFRLYGNMVGGENLLTAMTGMVEFLLPVPFYFLELLIGLVQALVFTILVAVYIGLICNHEGGEHAHE